MKRTATFIVLGFLFMGLFQRCHHPADVSPKPLLDTWVEAAHRQDTLVFKPEFSWLLLNRGKEIQNGSLVPKYGAGTYEYRLQLDSISLRNMYSSYSIPSVYFFKIQGNTLQIGDFYTNPAQPSTIKTFLKVE